MDDVFDAADDEAEEVGMICGARGIGVPLEMADEDETAGELTAAATGNADSESNWLETVDSVLKLDAVEGAGIDVGALDTTLDRDELGGAGATKLLGAVVAGAGVDGTVEGVDRCEVTIPLRAGGAILKPVDTNKLIFLCNQYE